MNQVTVQNTYKCLIWCKIMLKAKQVAVQLLRDLKKHEDLSNDIKLVIDKHLEDSVDDETIEKIRQLALKLPQLTLAIKQGIVTLRDEYKIFQNKKGSKTSQLSNVFVYRKRDALKQVLQEYDNVRNLVQVFDIKDLPYISDKTDSQIMRLSQDSMIGK